MNDTNCSPCHLNYKLLFRHDHVEICKSRLRSAVSNVCVPECDAEFHKINHPFPLCFRARVWSKKIVNTDSLGRFIVEEGSVPMSLWQYAEANGKLHYSLVPALTDAVKPEKSSEVLQSTVKIENNEVQHNITKTKYEENRSLLQLYEFTINFHTCDKCKMKFPTAGMLNRHKISHTSKSPLRKKRLSSKHARRLKLTAEKRNSKVQSQRSVETKYPCNFCDFKCNKRSALTVHVRKKHKLAVAKDSQKSRTRSYTCKSRARSNERAEKHKDAKTTRFACDTCSFVCNRSSVLVSHVAQNHRKSDNADTSRKKCKVVECGDESLEQEEAKGTCSQDENKESIAYRTSSSLECKSDSSANTRASKRHVKQPEEQCTFCDFKCSKKSTLYSHKRQHKANINEVFSCNECTFKTSKKSSLYSHIKRKHKLPKSCTADGQPELYQCNQCDYKNKNKYELKVHVARKHSDDYKFSCETCGKKFKVKGDLTNHIRFNHKEQPVICDVCGKTCLNSNSLYVHQKFAHYKAKYECQVCKRRMVSQENLNEHMIRQHERRENVVCEECGKTFSRNSRLKVHMRIHTGDRPYICTICNKSFARKTALKQHLLIHTGIRPYVCDICGKAFTQKPGLISHRKSHPGSHPPLPRVLIDHILNDIMNN